VNDDMRRQLDALLDARANRRVALGSLGAAGMGGVALTHADRAHALSQATPETTNSALKNPIDTWASKPVSELAAFPVPDISDEMKERHRIFSLLLLATNAFYFNGNKYGPTGEYPWREKQMVDGCAYEGGEYQGHNIAALAVDGLGQVVDFDFNHNNLFNSSVEHAESRLIRRLFSIAPLYAGLETRSPENPESYLGYGTVLSAVTLYTSLESCSQCSGIMTLGRVKDVVFLQRDPSQYNIGAILYNATANTDSQAPRPVPAREIGFDYSRDLDDRFAEFAAGVATKPFYRGATWISDSPSVTSFLCTDLAMDIYQAATAEFAELDLRYPDFAPDGAIPATPTPDAPAAQPFTNAEALEKARHFFEFVAKPGRRGTPHRL
jgi:tRNA(Arg) A34 adenosine deaminase TadA